MPISVQCHSCQARFRAADEHAGKRGKCPRCGTIITLPAVPPPAPVAPPPRPALAAATPASRSLMADLLDEAAAEPLPPTRCPSCGQMLPAGTVVCVNCGYNLRTGQRMKTVIERPQENKAAEGLKAAAGFAGSFLKGVVVCSLFTLVGTAVWIGIAIGIHLEIGWVAWGIGILAGLGMRFGYGKEDDVAGITAAFISVLGIVAAKWIIFLSLLPLIREIMAQVGDQAKLPSTASLFFQIMMTWHDGIFFLLAFFTAYKVGSGKATSD